ncbi:hypothetical protein [Methylobacterium radiodurans]|uniref:Uncharacterized protein n=1 Tax=Methylobacterium radiodurans TaxID=2202828 RepID=A0A2U8VY07_9HYPH|nr:hypothetical protein [Methylobacterium radiodurans]AWN38649.1 hypothetical protein DK427_25370 [Methylobacterium radiodurans]
MSEGAGQKAPNDAAARSAGEASQLDPHARAADYTLKPDPEGTRDPLGRADHDPHGRSADHTLQADPTGAHDPLPRAGLDPHGRTADFSNTNSGGAGSGGDLRDKVEGVGAQAREQAGAIQDRIGQAADEAGSRIRSAYGDARSYVSEASEGHLRRIDDLTDRGREGLQRGRNAVEDFVGENPLLVGVVGLAAGLLLGALLPRTRQEDRNLGPYADEVRDQGLRYAREFTNRGREFVQTALDPETVNAAARKAAGHDDAQSRTPDDPVRHTL